MDMIFYFSGTGNCLKIARDLAAELGGTDVVAIAKAVKEPTVSVSGRVGIVFPVYAFNVPIIVSDFVKKLKASDLTYVFAVATCAQVAPDVLDQLARGLKKQGLKLSAGFVIKIPSNYTPFGGAIPAERQEALFAKEVERVKEIASAVKDGRECAIETARLPLRLAGVAISRISLPMMKREDRSFWATPDCTGCGTCAKVCPVQNIKIIDKKPVWLHNCEQCFACLQWCPEEAIQCGKSTLGRKRYRNPYVKLQDFI